MLASMTGYGQAFVQQREFDLRVEMRSVNHRFLEISIRMPREFISLEEVIKKKVCEYVRRGKIELFVAMEKSEAAVQNLTMNWSLAKEYYTLYEELVERFPAVEKSIHPTEFLNLPGLVNMQEAREEVDKYLPAVLESVELACQQLIHMRKSEGKNLQSDLTSRLQSIQLWMEEIRFRTPLVSQQYRERLTNRMKEYLTGQWDGDEARILTEVAVFAEKASIDEELTRLSSHCQQFLLILQEAEPVGRKLDFLVQEMNREANTIGSKANDLEISKKVVDLKAELEKIKEQVQNIE
ncbi:YicC/YloC family endoribonuclease [Ammoniphilus sp. YIM 78166]|uniref:YicC/YloC family endoribonuclease n=1 Tax=Ammoniphilus sp. YIM 78166 TaxID=1644106 RepID=UPI00106FFBDB|nr:YicC/YloC family endoribonuclease [Ammoniphilus sp. YIM 78166]